MSSVKFSPDILLKLSGFFFIIGFLLLLKSQLTAVRDARNYSSGAGYDESSSTCGHARTSLPRTMKREEQTSEKTLTLFDYIDALENDYNQFENYSSLLNGDEDSSRYSRHALDTATIVAVREIKFNHSHDSISQSVKEIAVSRSPVKLSHSMMQAARDWNYWNISKVFLFADGALSIPIDDSKPIPTLFQTRIEVNDDDSSYLHQINLNTRNQITHHNREDLLFAELISGNHVRSKVRRFFAHDYRQFEAAAGVQGDIRWRDVLYNEPLAQTNNITSDDLAPLLWMLSPASALQLRYSEYHTFRIQLTGNATYCIISPEYAKHLHLFPSIHVASYQSQTQEKISVQRVHLQPSEILYIPPYHFVHIETGAVAAVGLDVLSPSLEQLILLEAFSMKMPFSDSSMTLESRVVSAQIYLVQLLSRVTIVRNPKSFARGLYKSRFASLFPKDSLFLQKNAFNCYQDNPDVAAAALELIDKHLVIKVASFVADAVNDPAVSNGVKTIWLQNYIETVALWAMRSAEDSVLFIRECLNFDYKLKVVEEMEGPSTIKIGD